MAKNCMMHRPSVGYALLFSVPVGAGVAVAVLRTAKRFDTAIAIGTVAMVLLFAFVVLVTATGSPAID